MYSIRQPAALGALLMLSSLSGLMAAPLVIAHRGASGYLPEHTIEAYRLAIEMGADFIEPDLVATRDGVLIARHEPYLGATTDIASRAEFATRRRTAVIDGVPVDDWFTTDFTLDELKTLRAVQPRADRSQTFNGRFQIPTFNEIVALAKHESQIRGRTIGIYPETKHPSWHCEQGLALEPRLLEALVGANWITREAPVFIQSFESGNLRWLRERTGVRLVQLIAGGSLDAGGMPSPASRWQSSGRCELFPQGELPRDFTIEDSFQEIARYADAVGPWKRFLIGGRHQGETAYATAPSRFVALAHAAGLAVHTWTFRNEPTELLADYHGDPSAEYRAFAALGVDGLFTDFPDTAIAALSDLATDR
ncbi:MAG: glycerophosphodiester phosphodiesterase [Steroidobacteraceae bacterium]